MSSLRPTLSASVAPPASVRGSSPIRGLTSDLLQARATVALALLTAAAPFPDDPESATASEFFAAFGDDDV